MFRFVKYLWWVLLPAVGNADCLDDSPLKSLDYQYEQAIRTADIDFLAATLLPDYVWVHNHAVVYETKPMLLARLGEGYQPPKSREQTEVSVRRAGDSAVITGYSTVDKFTDGPRRANRYHFIRTWVKSDAGCQLLAAQTMKVWSTEETVE